MNDEIRYRVFAIEPGDIPGVAAWDDHGEACKLIQVIDDTLARLANEQRKCLLCDQPCGDLTAPGMLFVFMPLRIGENAAVFPTCQSCVGHGAAKERGMRRLRQLIPELELRVGQGHIQ